MLVADESSSHFPSKPNRCISKLLDCLRISTVGHPPALPVNTTGAFASAPLWEEEEEMEDKAVSVLRL